MDRILSEENLSFLFSLENVVGLAYGMKKSGGHLTGEKGDIVLHAEKLTEERLDYGQRIPHRIQGMVSDVVALGDAAVRPIATPLTAAGAENLRLSRWRPAPGGTSIAHHRVTAGTLGCIVYDRGSGEPLILSNNHVLANATNGFDGRAALGDLILQPAPTDGGSRPEDAIARLERVAALKEQGYNQVDCAAAQPINRRLVLPEILSIGRVRGVSPPRLGAEIKKSGRSTGLTRGIIEGVYGMLPIRFGRDRVLYFRDQILIGSLDAPGDSGSLVLDEENRAVGLLFAGSSVYTIANPIGPVLAALCVKVDGADTRMP